MSQGRLIYVAAPYSAPDPATIAGRMAAFEQAVADLLRAGDFPISPLMNHTILGRHSIPGDWTFWQHYSRRLLARCDLLLVVDLPGWETSTGVQSEIELANLLAIPVEHVDWSQPAYDRGRLEYRQEN
jgi:hypothetical protein